MRLPLSYTSPKAPLVWSRCGLNGVSPRCCSLRGLLRPEFLVILRRDIDVIGGSNMLADALRGFFALDLAQTSSFGALLVRTLLRSLLALVVGCRRFLLGSAVAVLAGVLLSLRCGHFSLRGVEVRCWRGATARPPSRSAPHQRQGVSASASFANPAGASVVFWSSRGAEYAARDDSRPRPLRR
jgi:hypothetical protein